MNSLEQKREEFRKYLEKAGAIENLTKALIKLYEEQNKPEDVMGFIMKHMHQNPEAENEQVEALEKELREAHNKIVQLEELLSQCKGGLKECEEDSILTKGLQELEADEKCESLLKKHLSKELADELKNKKTSFDGTLLDCIQSGLKNHDSNVGVYACDQECFSVFNKLFDPVIEEYHGFDKEGLQPTPDFGEIENIPELDPEGEFIVSTRIRCGRSVENLPFNPIMKAEEYEQVRDLVKKATENLTEDFKGTFYQLKEMSPDLKAQLIDEHLMFKEGDRFLEAAQALRFWPKFRGIFLNQTKNFVVWCNEEDHLRIISIEKGGNLRSCYDRFVKGLEKISKEIKFARDENLGFLSFCPTNLGTSIRASVHIKLPKLSADESKFKEIIDKHNLQVRGTYGEHSESKDGILDISNKKRLGCTEAQLILDLANGIAELIEVEKKL